MKNPDEIIEEFEILKTKFENQGCPEQAFFSFVVNNRYSLLEKKDIIHDKLYFLFNHQQLYGLIVVNEESYSWSRYENGEFQTLKNITSCNQEITEDDFIIEMSIHFADSEKVKKIVPEINDMNVEGKVKMLKQIGLNSKGYHFR